MKKYTFLFLFYCASILAQARQSTVFQRGEDGYSCFRIPSIIQTTQGDLLAFAEGRKNSCSDTGNIDIVMKRSTDGGKTWSPLLVIWDAGENVCGNQSPILDPDTGKIILLCCWNLGEDHEQDIIDGISKDTRRVFVLTSLDHGISWTKPQDITDQVKKQEWTWYATGPCHGITLKTGEKKGRILLGTNHMVKGSKDKHSAIIYSDDKGDTWHLGAIQQEEGGNESTVAELSDGTILLNMRNYNREGHACRSQLRSKDGNEVIVPTKYVQELIDPICQGSLLSLPSQILVFSNPFSLDTRENLSLHISLDDGITWQTVRPITKGPAAYSDLVALSPCTVGVLFETGYTDPYECIKFQVVSISN